MILNITVLLIRATAQLELVELRRRQEVDGVESQIKV